MTLPNRAAGRIALPAPTPPDVQVSAGAFASGDRVGQPDDQVLRQLALQVRDPRWPAWKRPRMAGGSGRLPGCLPRTKSASQGLRKRVLAAWARAARFSPPRSPGSRRTAGLQPGANWQL
jgi:hypothetical protein